ncbi:hypothetical protein C1M53_16000 [Mesorhizobium sp. Pch-S]|nr:hypothetical protein C1M53_16000 [Mesorhizobium sp. Pch-S]
MATIALHATKAGRSSIETGHAAFHDFCLAAGILAEAPATPRASAHPPTMRSSSTPTAKGIAANV